MSATTTYPRQAWLVLGQNQLYLDDFDTGYACLELDIGYPEVREVVNNNPDRDGITDRTRLVGSRVVTATIRAWPGGSMTIDDIARLFGPYTWPAARPELHWTLDTQDHAERMLTLRAADNTSPMGRPIGREIHLGWVASDPYAYDPTAQTAVARPEQNLPTGRVYNLTFPRTYPGGSIAGESARIDVAGDVPAKPVIRIYGPITQPVITLTKQLSPTQTAPTVITFAFDATVTVATGDWIEIDCANRRAVTSSGVSLIAHVVWTQSSWPALDPGTWTLAIDGSTTSQITQAVATWNEGYLTP